MLFGSIEKAFRREGSMAPPTSTPATQAQWPRRRHSDPPMLWVAMSLASVAVHLAAFLLLRLLLMEPFRGWRLGTEFIPVEFVAVAAEVTPPLQLTQPPGVVAVPPLGQTASSTPPLSNANPRQQERKHQPTSLVPQAQCRHQPHPKISSLEPRHL